MRVIYGADVAGGGAGGREPMILSVVGKVGVIITPDLGAKPPLLQIKRVFS